MLLRYSLLSPEGPFVAPVMGQTFGELQSLDRDDPHSIIEALAF